MDIRKILSEAEIGALGEEALGKLENAYRTELAQAVKDEADRHAKKFNSLVESVNRKVESKIAAAINENVSRMKDDAISSKMYKTLNEMANLLEGVGIPCTELTKRLTEELADINHRMVELNNDREQLKKQLNQASKMDRIDALTAGCHPDVVQAARKFFKDKDIREINKDSVAKVISGDMDVSYPYDVDPDTTEEFNNDKITAALNEISEGLDLDVPGYKAMGGAAMHESVSAPRKKRFANLGNGLRAEKVKVPKGMMESVAPDIDDEVSDAMRQMAAFGELGLGGKFA